MALPFTGLSDPNELGVGRLYASSVGAPEVETLVLTGIAGTTKVRPGEAIHRGPGKTCTKINASDDLLPGNPSRLGGVVFFGPRPEQQIDEYNVGDAVPVVTRGMVGVMTDAAVTDGGEVFVNSSDATRWRAADDGGNTVQIVNAQFRSAVGAAGGGVAKLFLDGPIFEVTGT